MQKISIKTTRKNEFVDITESIRKFVEESGVKSGLCLVFCPHTTGAITMNENHDPAIPGDLIYGLEKMSPNYNEYRHSEKNSDAHVKSSVVGQTMTFIIEDSKLLLGQWQDIYFAEFDGPRSREVWIKIIKECNCG